MIQLHIIFFEIGIISGIGIGDKVQTFFCCCTIKFISVWLF